MTRTAIVLSALLVAVPAFVGTSQAGAQTPPPAQTPPAQKPPAVSVPPPAPAPAVAVPFATDSKIGFVNMQIVVSRSILGKMGTAQLKAFQDKKSLELSAKTKQIQDLQRELQQGQGVLTAAVLGQKALDLDRMNRELQLAQQNADAEYTALGDQVLNAFAEKTMPIVEALAKEKGLYLVFSEQSQVAYVSPSIDLSLEVIKRLDAMAS